MTLAFTFSIHADTVLVPEAYGRTDTVTAIPVRVSEVFHELAPRDLASGALTEALDNSIDVADLSTMLQIKAGLANTLTTLELKRIKQSMMKALKCMLVDLAPPGFLESRLATHYESSFSTNDAQQIIDSYHDVRDRPEKARLHTARLIFWEKARKDLATEARSWSQSFHIPSGAMLRVVPSLLKDPVSWKLLVVTAAKASVMLPVMSVIPVRLMMT